MRPSTPPRTPGAQSSRALERSLESMIQSADQSLKQLRATSPASTKKSSMKSRSLSAPRSMQATASSSALPMDADTNRKIDFLLKKTKKLEDSCRQLTSQYALAHEENKELKSTIKSYAESFRSSERNTAQLREQILNMKTRLDLAHHKDSLREAGSRPSNLDIGAVSEQIFQRVHREFKSVIDEVSRHLKDQQSPASFVPTYQPSQRAAAPSFDLEQVRSSISSLKHRQDSLDMSNREYVNKTQLAISQVTSRVHDELTNANLATRSLLESLSRQVNESLAQNISSLREEVFTKYDTTLTQLSASERLHSKRIVEIEAVLEQHKDISEQIASDISQLRHYLTSQRQHTDGDVLSKINYLHDKYSQMSNQITGATTSIRQLRSNIATTTESLETTQEQLSDHINDTASHIARLTEAGRNVAQRLRDMKTAASAAPVHNDEIKTIRDALRQMLTKGQIEDLIHDICESTVQHSIAPVTTQLATLGEEILYIKSQSEGRARLVSDDAALSDMLEVVHSSDEEETTSPRKRPSLTLVFPDAKQSPLVRKPSLTTLVYPVESATKPEK